MSDFDNESSSESDSGHPVFDSFFRDQIPQQRLSPYPNLEIDFTSSEESSDLETFSSNSSDSCVVELLNNIPEEPGYVTDDSSSSSECSLLSRFREIIPRVPEHNIWSVTKELYNREIGNYKSSAMWPNKFYQSLVGVLKLKVSRQLKKHRGCVNALDFNTSGNLLVSGSDDCKICLWDWSKGTCLFKYSTPHRRNIFQTKFLNIQGSNHTIVSSSQDGLVVLSLVNNSGCLHNKVIASHTRSCNKLSVHPAEPYVVLSCGDDGIVKSIDIRESPIDENVKITNILHNKYRNGNTMHLYGIDINPMNSLQFILNGDDKYVRLYDKRRLSSGPVKKFCSMLPNSRRTGDERIDNNSRARNFLESHITSAVYNYCGTEILASYSDDDIYLFDVNACPETYLHLYSGHLNRATVKGVNFYGPRSDYVVSGSDCGYLFIWEKKSEAIVLRSHADVKGAVNVLEGHPFMPTLATSGLDNTIKIWEPLNSPQKPNRRELRLSVVRNRMEKHGSKRSIHFR